MKSTLVLVTGALCGLSADHELATRYAPQSALRIETTSELALEVTDMRMVRDGEPVEGRGGFGGGGSETSTSSVVVDRYLEGSDGAVSRVQRIYEELEGESSMSMGGEDRSQTLESAFDGVVIEITRDEDGEVAVEVVEGSGPASEVLDRLRPELALDALLPRGPQALGAEWTLEPAAIRHALGLDVNLFARPAREEGGGEGGRRRGGFGRGGGSIQQQLGGAEWSGTATLEGIEEHEGVECARIALELEAESEQDDGEGSVSSFSAELEGSLWIDLQNRRPLALDVEGSLQTESDSVRERQGSTMEIHRASEGTLAYHVRVSETDFERE